MITRSRCRCQIVRRRIDFQLERYIMDNMNMKCVHATPGPFRRRHARIQEGSDLQKRRTTSHNGLKLSLRHKKAWTVPARKARVPNTTSGGPGGKWQMCVQQKSKYHICLKNRCCCFGHKSGITSIDVQVYAALELSTLFLVLKSSADHSWQLEQRSKRASRQETLL